MTPYLTSPSKQYKNHDSIEGDPTSIDIKAQNTGQSILSSITRFTTIGIGDVIECWFDSTSEGSTLGKWYVKKL